MSRKCQVCGKKAITGSSIIRRGMAKKKGGVGKKTTGITKRKFYPNLQTRRVVVNGKIKEIRVCVQCIRKGNLNFAGRKS